MAVLSAEHWGRIWRLCGNLMGTNQTDGQRLCPPQDSPLGPRTIRKVDRTHKMLGFSGQVVEPREGAGLTGFHCRVGEGTAETAHAGAGSEGARGSDIFPSVPYPGVSRRHGEP